ncbi:hypothetical protein VCRA2121O157_40132 [Vibrio crassostreae]|nr:hypothetical protein VCRA2119O381_200035 [Vibrio crassostreae]CAK1964106.1 hypothetical protein VCRA2114E122_20128 [Vibrio crassostreae]CAK1975405.1 hypothetical protein VCRA2113O207_20241 [Vibrio crassostreae]CAK1976941.1 hypothetical protein VCRA2114E123_20277 [Vibrio crassostreae]CAK1999314.1 hypothetical protein VCRA2116O234_20242 [Vibrio crassostreae]
MWCTSARSINLSVFGCFLIFCLNALAIWLKSEVRLAEKQRMTDISNSTPGYGQRALNWL